MLSSAEGHDDYTIALRAFLPTPSTVPSAKKTFTTAPPETSSSPPAPEGKGGGGGFLSSSLRRVAAWRAAEVGGPESLRLSPVAPTPFFDDEDQEDIKSIVGSNIEGEKK